LFRVSGFESRIDRAETVVIEALDITRPYHDSVENLFHWRFEGLSTNGRTIEVKADSQFILSMVEAFLGSS